ncbi:hypothetical protein HYN86_16935 [Flavobacterium fluviale]|uniref:Uncharacterized protein n=1 Tax=Flavobacterium fluviale TaxID=2249356 RepID=A0A344LW89_9FLAO|nr:hypothetical protein HYN86_16935 [Flavobacterium fluviale]
MSYECNQSYNTSLIVCHFDEGEIFVSSSTIKVNLCGVSCGDFSFVEMTNKTQKKEDVHVEHPLFYFIK